MSKLIALLAALLLLISPALAEEAPTLTLRTASSVDEVKQFLLLSPEDGLAPVRAGYIRYISQSQKRDEAFRKEYWLGGEEGSILDLTLKQRYEHTFDFHVGVMCTRAAYSMALSVLGIDMTPGEMSAVTGRRNLYEPYDEISEMVGVELIKLKGNQFNTLMNNYLTDERYSPVYLYFRKPNGTNHALLVVAYDEATSRFLVVDSIPYFANNQPYRVYHIALNKLRTQIINSTFYEELAGSTVLQVMQWRLIDPPAEEAAPAQP